MLITHIEAAPLGRVFSSLLYKQTYISDRGDRLINLGTLTLHYHEDFRMFMTTNMPMRLQGE